MLLINSIGGVDGQLPPERMPFQQCSIHPVFLEHEPEESG